LVVAYCVRYVRRSLAAVSVEVEVKTYAAVNLNGSYYV